MFWRGWGFAGRRGRMLLSPCLRRKRCALAAKFLRVVGQTGLLPVCFVSMRISCGAVLEYSPLKIRLLPRIRTKFHHLSRRRSKVASPVASQPDILGKGCLTLPGEARCCGSVSSCAWSPPPLLPRFCGFRGVGRRCPCLFWEDGPALNMAGPFASVAGASVRAGRPPKKERV